MRIEDRQKPGTIKSNSELRLMEELNRLLEQNPHDVMTYCERGFIHCQNGDLGSAMDDDEWAMEIDPRSPAAHGGRTALYLQGEDYARALTDITKAIKLSPNSGSGYSNRGQVYLAQNLYS
jgi:tetratricopeptide (TPR) repeat protein